MAKHRTPARTHRNIFMGLALAWTLLSAVLLGTGAHAAPLPGAAEPQGPAVFVVAHQDDELLSMGSSIRQHAEAGRHVVVVLVTDGSGTVARKRLSERLGCEVPVDTLVASRDREWRLASYRLGADERRIYPNRVVDATLTPAQADEVFDWVMTRWPGASVKSHSYLTPGNVDHRTLGEALLRAHDDGSIPDARFYLSGSEVRKMTAAGTMPKVLKVRRPVGDSEQRSYRYWEPGKWLSVGYTSVPTSFDRHRADPISYYHRPNV